jgi:Uma2 family endonuclease
MPATLARITAEEYANLPDTPEFRWTELHFGELVYVGAPKKKHLRIRQQILRSLRGVAEGLGEIAAELAFQIAHHDVREADIGFVPQHRWDAVRDNEYLSGAPDLTSEILSPSNTTLETLDRENLCLTHGCVEFWTADPERKTIRVSTASRIVVYDRDDSIESPLLPGWSARVADLLAD